MPKIIDISNVETESYGVASDKPAIITAVQQVEAKGDGIGYGDVVTTQDAVEKPKTAVAAADGAKWWVWLVLPVVAIAVVVGIVYIVLKKRK